MAEIKISTIKVTLTNIIHMNTSANIETNNTFMTLYIQHIVM